MFEFAIKLYECQLGSCLGRVGNAVAVLFCEYSSIFMICQSEFKINEFQIWTCLGKIPRQKPYFMAQLTEFRHFSVFNQTMSFSVWVSYDL